MLHITGLQRGVGGDYKKLWSLAGGNKGQWERGGELPGTGESDSGDLAVTVSACGGRRL